MRYQYTSSGFNNFSYNNYNFPPAVKFLLIINTIIYFITEISGVKYELFFINFGLVPAKVWSALMIWQPFTYLFLHGNFIHLIFNMFILWMFGKDLENQWGKKEFYIYYFVSGTGAAIITSVLSFNSYTPVVGASGAIYGILLAYGIMYPNRTVYLYGFLPLKVKFMVIGLGIIAFFASMTSPNSTTSHLTHIGGMIVGFLYLKTNFKKIRLWIYQKRIQLDNAKNNRFNDEKYREKIDEILDKLNVNGWDGLNQEEQKILYESSKKIYRNRKPN